MGRSFVPTDYPLVDLQTGKITSQWRRYQQDVATSLTPGSPGEVATSNGSVITWSLLSNAHIATGAAIAYAKLNLLGAIVDADIAAAAAIAWSKISKAGAVLADFGGTVSQAQKTTQAQTTLTGNQDNVALADIDSLICNNAALVTFRGFVSVVAGQALRLVVINAQVDLAHQDAGSTAANRIITPTAATVTITRFADLVYDGVTARWRVAGYV